MYLSRIAQKTKRLKNATKAYYSQVADAPHNNLEHLKTRQLISVEGNDAATLLQGMITNDIHHMVEGKMSSLYAMFLNVKGRVLSDSLIYCMGDKNSFIVEVDSFVSDLMMKHMKMYKLKKDVRINQMDSYMVFALYDPRHAVLKDDKGPLPDLLTCRREPQNSSTNGTVIKDLNVFCDPRLPSLGCRIIAPRLEVVHDELQVGKVNPPADSINYRWMRYNLGVGEGVMDIPPQVATPLEHNCDYMNGLNLNKGCYLGQELTARTYHTGKIRKRLMPLYLKNALTERPAVLNLTDDQLHPLGKLRGVHMDTALALLRMHLVVGSEFRVGATTAYTKIPFWWPPQKTDELADIGKDNKIVS